MTRLIDADALKETINTKKVVGRFNTIQLIDNAPTVELAKVTEAHEDIGYDRGFRDGYAQAVEEQPTGEWIPIDEKLPEQYSVLCCDKYGEIMIAHPFKDEESCIGFSAESENCYMFECVAWMPLPKPYKEGEE